MEVINEWELLGWLLKFLDILHWEKEIPTGTGTFSENLVKFQ
jgi:hypothetical protein